MINLALAIFGSPVRAEVISVPVEVSAQVNEKNYYLARQELIGRAFSTAVYRAAAGVLSSSGGSDAETQEQLTQNAADFVVSYKFLEESTDYSQDRMTATLEVAVNVDAIWARLKGTGAEAGKRKGKKVAILLHEERLNFLSKSDFLLLTSPSEESVAQAFRQNGYIVADRDQIRAAGLGPAALKAIEGDRESLAQIGQELEADALLFGKVTVKTSATAQGEKFTATIKAALYRPSDGSVIAAREEFGEIESADPSHGPLAAAQIAAGLTAREFLAVAGGLR